MENFFDVATPEEIKEICGEELTEKELLYEKQSFARFPDTNYAYLFKLYLLREDEKKAFQYLEKIEDERYKFTTSQLFYRDLIQNL